MEIGLLGAAHRLTLRLLWDLQDGEWEPVLSLLPITPTPSHACRLLYGSWHVVTPRGRVRWPGHRPVHRRWAPGQRPYVLTGPAS